MTSMFTEIEPPLADEGLMKKFGLTTSARPIRGYIPTLDGWRALAILGVVIAHAGHFSQSAYGAYGVDIFFGLSGFLICSRLLEEKSRSGTISLRGFYLRRLFRILPAYYVYLIAIAALQLTGRLYVTRGEWLSCLLFWRNYLPDHPHTIGWWSVGHSWTLAIEEHFYLLLPSLLLLKSWRRIALVIVSAALLVAVWRSIDSRLALTHSILPGVFQPGRTDQRLDSLLWGAFFGMLWTRWRGSLRWSPRLLSGLVILTCGLLAWDFVWKPKLHGVISAVLIPVALAGTTLTPTWFLSRILESPPIRWVGRLSYSLYLWQQIFFVPDIGRPPLGLFNHLPWAVAGTLVFAAASYYLVEVPMVQIGHRLTRSPMKGRQRPTSLTPTTAVQMPQASF